ncbi:N-acetyltransferase [Alkalihalophilus pseudofirmus]|uniref:N-acetyltransferase n=1 Tax=Alkalihalophilus pseudofirmus TaxID=79885 RepID=A0AAJ2KU73_ALKPS|nr:N-acetyltransferase [Alkalihalophilus pseudofirmus]MDV2884769.1 N-acetyltransferase [Alkalihalophilus pseudofirmus]
MEIALANLSHVSEVITFFNENLDTNNSAVYSKKFLCPLGMKAAIRRNQMMIATDQGQVVGAFRFYRKKTQKQISLYQFAISESHRGQCLLIDMLKTINDLPILVSCPTSSNFNEYYYKAGWVLQEQNTEFKIWAFNNEQ